MDKKVLLEYIDACELLQETEADLSILRRRGRDVLQDSVKGSMHDFPYTQKNFHIEGVRMAATSNMEITRMEHLLENRAAVVAEKREQAEKYLNELAFTSPRMVRIFKYRFLEGMTWDQVAKKLGRKATGESVRKEWKKFEKK